MNRLDVLHDRVIGTLKNKIPELQTCVEVPDEWHKPPQKRLSILVPAILVAVTTLTPEASDGTERLILKSEWQATCIVGGTTTSERIRAARALAVQVASIVHTNRFQVMGVEPAYVQTLKPADLDEELKYSAAAWVVTWEQRIYLGDTPRDIQCSGVQEIILNEKVRRWESHV